MSALSHTIYRFADFELNPRERSLRLHGEEIVLTPKVFDLLVLLVENAGRVLTKDELISALWPRGFVNESSLSRNVWLIRRALGEGERESRYIQTVPKIGYRFVGSVESDAENCDLVSAKVREASSVVAFRGAPAQRVGEDGSVDGSLAVMPSAQVHRPGHRRDVFIGLVLLTGVLLGIVLWHHRATRVAVAPEVAIVDFHDLALDENNKWLAPALLEMLGTELQGAADLRVVSDELVRGARVDLGSPSAGGYAPASVDLLRRRLPADYLVSGSYLVSGEHLRLDITLQDARSGAVVTSIARIGTVTDVSRLVEQVGGILRSKLGAAAIGAADLSAIANAQPPSEEVARYMGLGIDALKRGESGQARDALQRASQLAPDYAPTLLLLSRAWDGLGYPKEAKAALQQAAAHSQNLPEVRRIEIQEALYEQEADWPRAIAAQRRLIAMRPLDFEYHLTLFNMLAGPEVDQADAELAELRQLPGADEDARVEGLEGVVSIERGDLKTAEEHLRHAIGVARAHEATGVLATAEDSLTYVLAWTGRVNEAKSVNNDLINLWRLLGNVTQEAVARKQRARLLAYSGNLAQSDAILSEVSRVFERIGNKDQESSVEMIRADNRWREGDREGAEVANQRMLDGFAEFGYENAESYAFAWQSQLRLDTSASDEAADSLGKGMPYMRRAHQPEGYGAALGIQAKWQQLRGRLSDAVATCALAQTQCPAASVSDFCLPVAIQCGAVAADSGDLDAAAATFERLQPLAKHGNVFYAADAAVELGRIAIGKHDWPAAMRWLASARDIYAKAGSPGGEANAQALLALVYAQTGDVAQRDQAAARARECLAHTDQIEAVFAARIALAQVDAYAGRREVALTTLRELATDADKRKFMPWSLEAKLAAWELLDAAHDQSAPALRSDIEHVAGEHGFKWILSRLSSGSTLATR